MKQKAFFINFKGFSMKQITQIFVEGESPTLTNLQLKATSLSIYDLLLSQYLKRLSMKETRIQLFNQSCISQKLFFKFLSFTLNKPVVKSYKFM